MEDFIKSIHSDTDTISGIVIEPRVEAEQETKETVVFTPDPLELEYIADHGDATISFTEVESEVTSPYFQQESSTQTMSTLRFSEANETSVVPEWTTKAMGDSTETLTLLPSKATDPTTASSNAHTIPFIETSRPETISTNTLLTISTNAMTTVQNQAGSVSPSVSMSSPRFTKRPTTSMTGNALPASTTSSITASIQLSAKTSTTEKSTSTLAVTSISAAPFASTSISTSITSISVNTDSTTEKLVTISSTTKTVNLITAATTKTSKKYSLKDACSEQTFCKAQNEECDFPIENGMYKWDAPFCRSWFLYV